MYSNLQANKSRKIKEKNTFLKLEKCSQWINWTSSDLGFRLNIAKTSSSHNIARL